MPLSSAATSNQTVKRSDRRGKNNIRRVHGGSRGKYALRLTITRDEGFFLCAEMTDAWQSSQTFARNYSFLLGYFEGA